jgi:hypothetical protein
MLKDADAINANSGKSAVAFRMSPPSSGGRGWRSRQRSSTPAGNHGPARVANRGGVDSRKSQSSRRGLAVKNRTEKVELWSKADAWGYDSLWVFDHFYPIFVPDPAGRAWRDGLCFSALSQHTTRAPDSPTFFH